jgi:5-formyltetrahydrofolate cyclo-ligase
MSPPYDAGMDRDPAKVERRRARRAARRDLAGTRDPAADSRALAAGAVDLVERLGFGPGAVVLSYASVPGEPPTAELNTALAARGIRVLLPITEPDLDLDWHDADDPAASPLGREAPVLADLVLAPGLAVDTRGTRMGQGGGCYDRALPRRRNGVRVVVLLHPGELVDPDDAPLPRQPHDVAVDGVLTAEGLRWLTVGTADRADGSG